MAKDKSSFTNDYRFPTGDIPGNGKLPDSEKGTARTADEKKIRKRSKKEIMDSLKQTARNKK